MFAVRRAGGWLMSTINWRSRIDSWSAAAAAIDLLAGAIAEINEQWRPASGNVVKSFLKQ